MPALTRGDTLLVNHDGATWEIDPKNGKLLRLAANGQDTLLSNGPQLYLSKGYETFTPEMDWTVEAEQSAGKVTITAKTNTNAHFTWIFETGSPVALDYDFGRYGNPTAYAAVGFDLPDSAMRSKRWLGLGPYPVWENRMEGPQMGIWENEYNEGAAGFHWEFPEFKGIFGDVSWMQLKLNTDKTLTIQPSTPIHIGISRPVPAPFPAREKPAYPESGGLFLFHDAPGIGDKMTVIQRYSPLSGYKPVVEPIKGRVQFDCR